MDYFLFYAFDWDDNLLFMDTKIICLSSEGEEVGVSTSDFVNLRKYIGYQEIEYKGHTIVDYAEHPFRNFGDDGNTFLKDVIDAIENKRFGPSWEDFIECLINGSLFAIITARAHERSVIKEAIEYILDNFLTQGQKNAMLNNLFVYHQLFNKTHHIRRTPYRKGRKFSNMIIVQYYLDECDFVGISSPSRGGSPDDPEKAKEEALIEFKIRVNDIVGSIGAQAKIGFSDDDPKNANHIENLFNNLHHEMLPNIKEYIVKNTSGGEIKKTKRIIWEK